MKLFYVYEHWRPDRNECFYVGKGHGKRANDMRSCRNRWHKFIQQKLSSLGMCVEVRLIAEGLEEEESFRFERERIAFWRADGVDLVNMTAGGEGLKQPSLEVREKMSVSQRERFDRPGEREKTSLAFKGRITSEATKEKLRQTSTGFRHTEQTKAKMREHAKSRCVSKECRAAQRIAVTGKKRAPFSAETIAKMKVAAAERARRKREVTP